MNYRRILRAEKAMREAAKAIDKHFELEGPYVTRLFRDVSDPKHYRWELHMNIVDYATVSTEDGVRFLFMRSGVPCWNECIVKDGEDTWETFAEVLSIVATEIKLTRYELGAEAEEVPA